MNGWLLRGGGSAAKGLGGDRPQEPSLAALSAHGPFPEARFCPTGGVTPQTAGSYLEQPNVLCVGGSWLTPGDLIKAGDWGRIELLAREAAALRPVRVTARS